MAEVIKTGDVGLLTGKVAVLGYGSQGHAHALNLADSGVEVEVGLRAGSTSRAAAEEAGLAVRDVAEAVQRRPGRRDARPRRPAGGALPRRGRAEPRARRGAALRPRLLRPLRPDRRFPTGIDVIMVAPKGPGHIVRRLYEEGYGTPGADRGRPGRDRPARATLALAYAAGIGAGRAGILETTFAEETETDLFGEQSVLCGGLTQLIQAGFETLVEAGYQPEIAYYECVHEVKLIVDLIFEGGIERMHYSISDTAEYGSIAVGPRVVDAARQGEHAAGARRRSRTARSRASGSPRWTRAARASSRRATALARDRRSSRSASACARSAHREVQEAHGVG